MSGIELPKGAQIQQVAVSSDLRLLLVSGYFVAEENDGNLWLCFDSVLGASGVAQRVSIPFGRLQFAEFVRKMQAMLVSNGRPDAPELLQ